MTQASETKRRYHSPLRQQQADATRRRIAKSAMELFAKQGFGSTSVSDIARAAGVSAETIYGTFGTKQGLLSEIAALVSTERFPLERWARAQRESSGDARGQLRELVEIMGDFYASNPDVVALFGRGSGDVRIAFDTWRDENMGDATARFSSVPANSLRQGLDLPAAALILDVLLAPELYARFVEDAGWTLDVYKERIYSMLEHALFA
jgi:TetR/AcrR family transcriptional regulator, regulator of cefoperazone and chloramphenicol sensitivity